MSNSVSGERLDKRARANLFWLISSQTLFISSISLNITVGGLTGQILAPHASMATWPVSAAIVGLALATLPVSLLMRYVGRRWGFMVGSLVGVFGGLVSALAVELGSFWLLMLGTLCIGGFAASAQLYRFVATEVVPLGYRARAMAWVLSGGIFAGGLGPQLGKWTYNMFAAQYLGSYLAIAVTTGVSLFCVSRLRVPSEGEISAATASASGADSAAESEAMEERPLRVIASQPLFWIAVLGAAVGYGLMTLLMTATPLVMTSGAHDFRTTATVIQWHVVAMFAPGLFSGVLIERFGEVRIIFCGILLYVACLVVASLGQSFGHYLAALVSLGVGWNFMFIGGSTLLTRTYRPRERMRVQASNDFLTFGIQAVGALSAGALLSGVGWVGILWGGGAVIGCTSLILLGLSLASRRGPRLAW